MPRTTGFALPALAFALLAAAPTCAQAAQEDTQFWTIFTAEGSPAEDLSLGLEVNPRFRSDAVGGDVLQTRATADYRLTPAIAVGGGLLYAEFAGGNEVRPHQQVTVRAGLLAFRTRLEERFFAGADRMEIRLRQRVQASLPLVPGTSLVASGEFFGILRSRRNNGDAKVDQLRANVTLRRAIAPNLGASVGYLLIVVPKPGPNQVSHVPQLGLTFSF